MRLPTHRRLWWLALLPLLAGLWRLHFDVEVLNLLPEKAPEVRGLKLYQSHFSNARELIVTLRGPDADAVEATARSLAESLRKVPRLAADVTWQPPWMEFPGQAAELVAHLWFNQPPAVFGELTNRLAPERLSAALEQTRRTLATSLSPIDIALRSNDPFGLTQLPEGVAPPSIGASPGELFGSADGTFRLVFIQAAEDLRSYKACVRWFGEIRAEIERWRTETRPDEGVVLQFTGRPAFVAEISSGMERDMAGPSAGTLFVIAGLFYWVHRRWRPLVWLMTLLGIILVATLALGGLFIGTLNVVSLGFASILLGLAEDFGIVLYQESRSHPHLDPSEIRRHAAPGILWSAVTTAGAFSLLNLSGLPGLGQLGTMVAIGIVIAAVVMLVFYLPPLARRGESQPETTPDPHPAQAAGAGRVYRRLSWIATAAVVAGTLLMVRPPAMDSSPGALRPKESAAYAALDELKTRMDRQRDPLWLVLAGRDEAEVAARLDATQAALDRATAEGTLAGATLPTALWPRPDRQAANRPIAVALAAHRPALHAAAQANGFTEQSLGFTDRVLETWERAARSTGPFWPTNANSRWVLGKLTARHGSGCVAVGLVHLPATQPRLTSDALARLTASLPPEGVVLSGWELLGDSISREVIAEMPRVLVPILILVVVTLWLAYRRIGDVLLSLASVVFAGMMLLLLMRVFDWRWNMINLMAVPLLLGMGVDFSIHIQLALRRHGGDLRLVRDSIGRALLLAGTTTVAGFASLAFASNAGIASLGQVCGAGIVCAMVTAVYLLPVWWAATQRTKPT